ncbi:hypothetical protein AAC387_Pa03g1067 [Persea americana]
MANQQVLPFLLFLCSLFAALCSPCLAFQEDRKVYIVYMGALPNNQLDQFSIQNRQLSVLQNVLQGSLAKDRLVESYKRSFNGFAASLTEEEQQKIARMEGVLSVFPSKTYQLHTTSFNDEGFGPPPRKWKGICQTDGNFTCNNKVIGARYYKGAGVDVTSARDTIGHGNARGAVPSIRIAVYKVCDENDCSDSTILAGFDDVIADGVDILSVSIGSLSMANYSSDSIAIGSFQAMLRGTLTSQSAGNSGPDAGRSTNTFGSTKSVPLILAANALTSCNSTAAGKLVKGKIIFCEDTNSTGDGALSSGAQGQIMQYEGENDDSPIFPLPSTIVDLAKGDTIKSYTKRTKKPQGKILKSIAIRDKTAEVVVSFSSRGPNPISSNILKPDITAPSVGIIVAYSPAASLTGFEQDKRSAKYAILSGTSMSCPHMLFNVRSPIVVYTSAA